MRTAEQLRDMEDHELVHEVLCLQETLRGLRRDEASASQIHNYHFASSEVIKLTEERYLGSGIILSICSLSGKPIVKPITLSDGLRVVTINALLDELERTYHLKVAYKPIQDRL